MVSRTLHLGSNWTISNVLRGKCTESTGPRPVNPNDAKTAPLIFRFTSLCAHGVDKPVLLNTYCRFVLTWTLSFARYQLVVDKMSDAPAQAKATKATKPKAPKKPAEHPKFSVMIVEAITQLKEVRLGSSTTIARSSS